MKPFLLGSAVSLSDLVEVVSLGRPVRLPPSAKAKVARARSVLERAIASGEPVYGVNTGFGELASQRIPSDAIRTLQYNLLRSHACGVGGLLSPEVSLAIVFLRANELARGHSGCRPQLVELLAGMVNRGIAPAIPSRGSVGASGDLAPQAHAALVVIGEGRARMRRGKAWSGIVSGKEALRRVRLKPLELEAKEGLSLINGTQAMQAVGGLSIYWALRVIAAANVAGAMSLEAIKGTPVPYEDAIVRLKPHLGQRKIAALLLKLLAQSEIRESHRSNDPRVQDPYSFRCIPQVHGAAQDALEFALRSVETEMASVTDNPVVVGGQVISGGNFHGQALSMAYDFAGMALTTLGNISERRIAQLISGENGLPSFLARDPGLESGFMIPQVAAAALASENKILAHPASIDSIPTSANKEDFVSMGMAAALKLGTLARRAAQIVAIELVTAAQAVEHHQPLKPGAGVALALKKLRSIVLRAEGDKTMSDSLIRVHEMILNGDFEEITG